MSKGFGSIHAAAGMKNYLERKVKSEIERTKPGPRNAQVVSIDRTRKKCEVRYPGESGTVWVPYGSVEPAGPHVKVKIDGPVGERRIVEVYGKTRTVSRIERLESAQTASPIWAMSMSHWAETFPLMWSNPLITNLTQHNTSEALVSPVIITRDMYISTVEVKLRRFAIEHAPFNIVSIGLHKVDPNERDAPASEGGPPGDISFNLRFVYASSGRLVDDGATSMRYGMNLRDPVEAKAGEVYTVSVYTACQPPRTPPRMEPQYHPVLEYLDHAHIVKTLGKNQFAMGRFPSTLQHQDVPRSQITPSLTQTLWAALYELPAGEGYIETE